MMIVQSIMMRSLSSIYRSIWGLRLYILSNSEAFQEVLEGSGIYNGKVSQDYEKVKRSAGHIEVL